MREEEEEEEMGQSVWVCLQIDFRVEKNDTLHFLSARTKVDVNTFAEEQAE